MNSLELPCLPIASVKQLETICAVFPVVVPTEVPIVPLSSSETFRL